MPTTMASATTTTIVVVDVRGRDGGSCGPGGADMRQH